MEDSAVRYPAIMLLAAVSCAALPAMAQTSTSSSQADKGIKTQNSGASGYVGEQERPGSAAHLPGDPNRAENTGRAATAPSAQNSGAGIAGAPGNKNGPTPRQGTVGSASQNLPVQEQDSSNIKGLPGNKSGPPAKH
jgi:hypothetical protein